MLTRADAALLIGDPALFADYEAARAAEDRSRRRVADVHRAAVRLRVLDRSARRGGRRDGGDAAGRPRAGETDADGVASRFFPARPRQSGRGRPLPAREHPVPARRPRACRPRAILRRWPSTSASSSGCSPCAGSKGADACATLAAGLQLCSGLNERTAAGAGRRRRQGSGCPATRRSRSTRDAPTHVLGRLADGVRARKHPERIVTYIIDRNVNYTNVCVARCNFCAFYRPVGIARGLRARLRGDLPEDRRDDRRRRRAAAAAGRAQPGPAARRGTKTSSAR